MTDTTIVFEINLSTGDECREWSYLELVQNHLVHNRRADGENDPFSEKESMEEQRLKELAKSLERKYVTVFEMLSSVLQGTMVTVKKSGKRKRVRIDDFLDPGEGYDTQDSFIDDSEAVDVFLAPNISTKHGGFYVYEGSLEGLEYQDAEIEAPIGSKSTTTAISRTGTKKNKSKELLEKAVKCLSAPKQSPGMSRSKMQHLDSVFDAVLSNPPTTDVDTAKSGTDTPIRSNSDSTKTKPVPNDSEKPSQPPVSEAVPPPLPNSLPAEVTNAVANLIKLASANGSTPRRLIGRPFELELVNLASALNGANISQSARSIVFAHIEGVLHWKRKSLMRRLKKLNETNEDQKIHPLLDALCDAISRAMPALLESYLRDKELHAERLKTWQAE
ncbi:hypothetical protein PHET_09234 [Paragonimus heterotremus]|uniref:Hpc2-related domain-containing protein n=1 Tax=Paragonimus heterotremus TaxID=100268 RepID=A0A8J4WSQ1_9TREM|nr:hypothetical protein PHET_09234 [Paragonimus heterotremus]